MQSEAEAEAAQRRLAEEGRRGLNNRCPECGALGSLEEQDDDASGPGGFESPRGKLRCVDCDVVIAATSRLGGLGRK